MHLNALLSRGSDNKMSIPLLDDVQLTEMTSLEDAFPIRNPCRKTPLRVGTPDHRSKGHPSSIRATIMIISLLEQGVLLSLPF